MGNGGQCYAFRMSEASKLGFSIISSITNDRRQDLVERSIYYTRYHRNQELLHAVQSTSRKLLSTLLRQSPVDTSLPRSTFLSRSHSPSSSTTVLSPERITSCAVLNPRSLLALLDKVPLNRFACRPTIEARRITLRNGRSRSSVIVVA